MSVEQPRSSGLALCKEVMNVEDHYSRSMMKNRKNSTQLEYSRSFSKDQKHGGKMWRYFTLESLLLLLCLTVTLLILPLVLPPLPPPPFLLLLLPISILALLMFLAFIPASHARHATYTYV